MGSIPAPYRSRHGYAALAAYREAGLDDCAFLAQQFQVGLVQTGPVHQRADSRTAAIAPEIDRLPLQVKDVIRGAVEEIQVIGDHSLDPSTLASWSNGVVRISGTSRQFDRPHRGPAALHAGSLLRTTLVHECGHVLAEDARGGVALRDYLAMLAASGWLPDPLHDPTPFGTVGGDVRRLADHYGRRLKDVGPTWDLARPLRDPASPGVRQFDRDVMGRSHGDGGPRPRRTLGLQSPGALAAALTSRYQRQRLERELAGVGLTLSQVEHAINRRGPISPYAAVEVAETPAELFAVLHRGRFLVHTEPEALREGQRVLCEPWLQAERDGPPRGLAPRLRASHTRFVGRVPASAVAQRPTRGR
ncbi:MAG TPA: hypothetical protein VNN74_09955 [Candidatus Micrarchaeia archaeon]|nr:hypothetical protein [Candidatus Micrarchaeia archaeon]